jgi:hypothetical protein
MEEFAGITTRKLVHDDIINLYPKVNGLGLTLSTFLVFFFNRKKIKKSK